MKINYYSYILVVLAGFFVLGSCRKEKIQPDQANTFIKYYGGNATNTAGSVDQTSDGGYILIGTSNANGNDKDIVVTKTDKYGNTLWTKIIGGPGDDIGNFIHVTADGGYIIAASRAEPNSTTFTDADLIKMSSDGTIQFDSTYGYSGKNETAVRVISTIDGGYISIGITDSIKKTLLNPISQIFLVKTITTGQRSWTTKFGNGNESANKGTSVLQVNDSTYLTSASTISNSDVEDILITQGRYQTNGKNYQSNSNWYKTSFPGNTSLNTELSSVINATDIIINPIGNYYVLGNTKTDVYLLNITSQTFTSFGTSAIDSATAFTQTSDGGFIITGTTYNTTNQSLDILVIKTDVSGNVSWIKNYGGTGNDYGSYVKQTSDGGYIVSGTVQFGGNETGSNPVMALFKLNSNGDLE